MRFDGVRLRPARKDLRLPWVRHLPGALGENDAHLRSCELDVIWIQKAQLSYSPQRSPTRPLTHEFARVGSALRICRSLPNCDPASFLLKGLGTKIAKNQPGRQHPSKPISLLSTEPVSSRGDDIETAPVEKNDLLCG